MKVPKLQCTVNGIIPFYCVNVLQSERPKLHRGLDVLSITGFKSRL